MSASCNTQAKEASEKLLELVAWVRDKLGRLHLAAGTEFMQQNLHALIRACDPETNPRLKSAVDALEEVSRGND